MFILIIFQNAEGIHQTLQWVKCLQVRTAIIMTAYIWDENFSSFKTMGLSLCTPAGEDDGRRCHRKDPNLSGNLQSCDIHHRVSYSCLLRTYARSGPTSKLVPHGCATNEKVVTSAPSDDNRWEIYLPPCWCWWGSLRCWCAKEKVGCLGLGRILDFPSSQWRAVCLYLCWCCPRLISEKANEIIGSKSTWLRRRPTG